MIRNFKDLIVETLAEFIVLLVAYLFLPTHLYAKNVGTLITVLFLQTGLILVFSSIFTIAAYLIMKEKYSNLETKNQFGLVAITVMLSSIISINVVDMLIPTFNISSLFSIVLPIVMQVATIVSHPKTLQTFLISFLNFKEIRQS